MLLARPPSVKKKSLKLVLTIDNPKSIEFGLKYTTYNRADSTSVLYYRTRVTFWNQ